MMDKKGVSSTLAYVIIFGVAFLILTTSIVVINQMEDRLITSSSEEKLEEIGDMIGEEVTQTYLVHLGNGSFQKNLRVPSEVNGVSYRVLFDNDSIKLVWRDIVVEESFFSLNKSISLEGEAWSSDRLMIYFDGNKMVLNGK